jgi:hypothetical protein
VSGANRARVTARGLFRHAFGTAADFHYGAGGERTNALRSRVCLATNNRRGAEAGIPSSGPSHGLILVELTTAKVLRILDPDPAPWRAWGSNHALFVPTRWIRTAQVV